jgi:uncharacterized RDD family membrane protein YckC
MAFCAKCGKELPAGVTFCPNCGAPVQPGASTAEPTATMSGIDSLMKDSKAQGYWVRRLAALIVDYVIIAVVLGVIFAVAAASFFFGGYGAMTFFFGGFTIVVGVLLILYFPLTESMWGASLGKRLLGLKVVSKSGTNPTFVEAFVRNISKIYWLLLLLDVIVGLATSKGYQQKYSDHMMGTSVVPA